MNAHTPTAEAKGPDAVDIHAGLRMREIRRSRNLTQDGLAEAVGISFQQIQKYERGTNRMSLSRAHHIAKALGVSVAAFYEGLAEDWERGEMPYNTVAWSVTTRGQQWASVGERLPPEEFYNVIRVVELIAKGKA